MSEARPPFIMVFDDSCPSHREIVIPALLERELTGTFYLVPASKWYDAAYWTSVAREPGIVLANHTFTHAGATSVEEAEEDIARADRFLDALEDAERPDGRVVDPNDPAYAPGQAASAEEVRRKKARKPRSFCIPGGTPWTLSPQDTKNLLDKYHLIHRPRTPFFRADTMTPEELLSTPDRALAAGPIVATHGPSITDAGVDPTQSPADPKSRPFPATIDLPGYLMFHGVGGDWLSTERDLFLRLLDKLVVLRELLWITDPVSWQWEGSASSLP